MGVSRHCEGMLQDHVPGTPCLRFTLGRELEVGRKRWNDSLRFGMECSRPTRWSVDLDACGVVRKERGRALGPSSG